jgi:hypothetical protein
MMMLRMAGVSIPPQLMREPKEPGYREREPILVSVSGARPVVKVGFSGHCATACDRLDEKLSLPGALHTAGDGYTLSVGREAKMETLA